MADTSTQTFNRHVQRMATSLMRANGGTTAWLQMPPATPVATEAAEMGLAAPAFQLLPLAPAVFRRVRATITEGQPAKYELLIAALAVQAAVSELKLSSADALFSMAAGVVVDGKLFLLESTSMSEALGQVYLYRLLLRETSSEWPMQAAS